MNELTEDQLMIFHEAFSIIDKNKDGFITSNELEEVMKSIGFHPTEDDLKHMIKALDLNRNGKIEFEEFVTMMLKEVTKPEFEREMKDAFKVIDKDGNGYICHDELKDAMNNLGENLTDNEIQLMIKEADLDGDGQVNYDEFEKFMVSD